MLVSSSIDAYYPMGGAACCTPSLLLETGDAWEFERCDCVASNDINCGGLSTHRLLFGFDHWRCGLLSFIQSPLFAGGAASRT